MEAPLPLPGRITGSASIDTLDRAGLERDDADNPIRKRIIIQDFKACNSGELSVSRNQHVKFLYQEHNWNYVKDETGTEGYIPADICVPLTSRPSADDLQVGGTVIRNKNYNSFRSAPAIPSRRLKDYQDATDAGFLTRSHGHAQVFGAPDLIQHVRKRTAMSQTPLERQSVDNPYNPSPEELWHYRNGGFRDEIQHGPGISNSDDRRNGKELPSFSQSDLDRSIGHSLNFKERHSLSPHSLSNTSGSSPKSINSPHNSSSSSNPKNTEQKKFQKTPQGNYFVKSDFSGTMENDVSVQRGYFVTLLNKEDPDWYWVMTANKLEGFVPASYLLRADSSSPNGKQNIIYIKMV